MPTVKASGAWKITVYADDHNPPHFHILTAEHEVLVLISNLQVIAGSMKASVLREALAWAAQNRAEIEDAWTRYNG